MSGGQREGDGDIGELRTSPRSFAAPAPVSQTNSRQLPRPSCTRLPDLLSGGFGNASSGGFGNASERVAVKLGGGGARDGACARTSVILCRMGGAGTVRSGRLS